MNKRTFIQSLGLGVASLTLSKPLLGHAAAGTPTPILRPRLLKRGDTVGIITPSSAAVNEEAYTIATENFDALGLRIKWGANSRKRHGFLGGTDDERLADLHGMFSDPDVKAIVCLRGGSGAARLLDKIDYRLIARNPKIFMGYSDITAFHQAIVTQTGLVTFHGPVANSPWTPWIFEQFEQLFFEGKPARYENRTSHSASPEMAYEPIRTISPGIAEGRLLGGNLTVLTGIAGSKYFPDFTDSILFLEDIDEAPYRVDRMFSQLALTGGLKKIRGFIFGKCSDCEASNPERSLTLEQLLDDYIKPQGVPAYDGALIGHIDEQFILPMGARIRMDANEGNFTLMEDIFARD